MSDNAVVKTFQYVYIDPETQKKKKGTIEASSNERAYQALQEQDIAPLKITNLSDDILKKEINIPGMERKASIKALSIFCNQFSLLIEAGIPMLESLSILSQQTEDKTLNKALGEVRDDVESGNSLSESMEKHPKAFPELLIAIVKVGEEGGFLDQSLKSMAKTYKTELELKRKIRAAMMYPMIVLSVSLLVVGAMIIFVVPIFADMFSSMGAELPFITQVLVTISSYAVIIVPVMLVLAVILAFLYRRYIKEDWLRSRVDKFKLKVPVFGELNTKVAISRFSRNLSMMIYAAVPLIQSLKLVSNTANNWLIANAIDESIGHMENGRSFSTSIDKFTMFPPMVKNMIVVGENSGKMGKMLETVADYYDDEVKDVSDNLAASIEPIMIVFLGLIIGGMLLAMYMPMFSLFNEMSAV